MGKSHIFLRHSAQNGSLCQTTATFSIFPSYPWRALCAEIKGEALANNLAKFGTWTVREQAVGT